MPASRPAAAALGGRFVTLRPLGEEDFGALFDVIGHPEVFSGGYGGGVAALRDSRDEFAEWLRGYLPWETGLSFGVCLRGGPHDGELVGTTSLADLDLGNEGAHIGWTAYDPRVWGSVVNAEAKLLLLSLAFEHGFSRVRLQADAANERSRAAILRLGATFEGVLRHDRRRADGSWRDTAVHSVLVEEWPAVRDGLEARLEAQGERPVLYRGSR
ncbi:GNAT family N-acetyltransferase [Salinibacterium sp. dk2585]|uniref:GNAT family N-acetyltransferase n=1 Tax=unclassified Salinibacterium TaxID=2632331 RepID=UPI0011C25490|nr:MULTISPECIES: GNAT family protein [unclassified Salinibacterium]QEE60353.1 GNAT family N-acetyltransferase [Salinibacterium sp. dk2585]TXK55426.1 GNAT family N-acetyltransferase [Salinibacterium sp. dk5596]